MVASADISRDLWIPLQLTEADFQVSVPKNSIQKLWTWGQESEGSQNLYGWFTAQAEKTSHQSEIAEEGQLNSEATLTLQPPSTTIEHNLSVMAVILLQNKEKYCIKSAPFPISGLCHSNLYSQTTLPCCWLLLDWDWLSLRLAFTKGGGGRYIFVHIRKQHDHYFMYWTWPIRYTGVGNSKCRTIHCKVLLPYLLWSKCELRKRANTSVLRNEKFNCGICCWRL